MTFNFLKKTYSNNFTKRELVLAQEFLMQYSKLLDLDAAKRRTHISNMTLIKFKALDKEFLAIYDAITQEIEHSKYSYLMNISNKPSVYTDVLYNGKDEIINRRVRTESPNAKIYKDLKSGQPIDNINTAAPPSITINTMASKKA